MLIQPIETIIFDLDGTLRHNIPSADDVQFKYVRENGVPDAPGLQNLGTRWSHYYWAQSDELSSDLEQFGEMNDGFWIQYAYRYLLALKISAARASSLASSLCQHMEDTFVPNHHVYPCVPDTLQAFRGAGYTIGLVSNRSTPCQEECEQIGLLAYLDFAYVAAEVDAWKPNPRIFDRALEITGSAPARTIYVGDNYFADIPAAQNAGLQAVLLDPKGVFPEAECQIIRTIGDLAAILL